MGRSDSCPFLRDFLRAEVRGLPVEEAASGTVCLGALLPEQEGERHAWHVYQPWLGFMAAESPSPSQVKLTIVRTPLAQVFCMPTPGADAAILSGPDSPPHFFSLMRQGPGELTWLVQITQL